MTPEVQLLPSYKPPFTGFPVPCVFSIFVGGAESTFSFFLSFFLSVLPSFLSVFLLLFLPFFFLSFFFLSFVIFFFLLWRLRFCIWQSTASGLFAFFTGPYKREVWGLTLHIFLYLSLNSYLFAGVHPATFNGSSSATDYSMTSNAAVLAKLAFDLRTRESDTTVLETSFNGDKLVAEIKNGFLSVEYTLGGRTGNVTSGTIKHWSYGLTAI